MDDTELSRVMARLLDGAEHQLGTLVLDAVRPYVENAFRQGVKVGVGVSRRAMTQGMEAAERSIERAMTESPPTQNQLPPRDEGLTPRPQFHQQRASSSRAAPGTIRPIVEAILTNENEGLRIVDIQHRAADLDAYIASASISNELRRNPTRYRQEGTLWFLIGDKENDLGLAPRRALVPGSSAEDGNPETSGVPSNVSYAA